MQKDIKYHKEKEDKTIGMRLQLPVKLNWRLKQAAAKIHMNKDKFVMMAIELQVGNEGC